MACHQSIKRVAFVSTVRTHHKNTTIRPVCKHTMIPHYPAITQEGKVSVDRRPFYGFGRRQAASLRSLYERRLSSKRLPLKIVNNPLDVLYDWSTGIMAVCLVLWLVMHNPGLRSTSAFSLLYVAPLVGNYVSIPVWGSLPRSRPQTISQSGFQGLVPLLDSSIGSWWFL